MAVGIGTVRGLFKTLLEGIAGIDRAHKYMPRDAAEANCPQWLIVPADATHERLTGQQLHLNREWDLILLFCKETSMPYGDFEIGLDPFFELVEDAFAADLKIGSVDTDMIHVYIIEDTGPRRIEFPPDSRKWWFGAQWTVDVTTKREF